MGFHRKKETRQDVASPKRLFHAEPPKNPSLRSKRFVPHAIASLGGIVFALSSPPTDFLPAVFIGLGALFVALRGVERARSAAWLATIWATSAGIVGMRFVPSVIIRFTDLGIGLGVLALVLLSLVQAGIWAFGIGVARALEHKTGLDPWIGFGMGVVISITFVFVIAWTPAGLLSPWPALIQLAELIGERGVSFLIAVAAALLATPFVRLVRAGAERIPPRRLLVAPAFGAALLGLMLAHGAWRMREVRAEEVSRPKLDIGVVQAAVEARMRWEPRARDLILGRLKHLTLESERGGAKLTLWPEAAYPYVLDNRPGPMPHGRRGIIADGIHGPVLFGLITRAPDQAGYNAATVVRSDGSVEQPQAKMHLLWFGETVPLGEHLPFLRKLFSRAGGLVPGENVQLLEAGPARIGVLNCYEDTLPAVGRKIARKSPNLLVNVTNDAWFGPTAEPELHLRLSVLRAVETRLDLVRAVNLGVPAFIDASGTVLQRGATDAESVMRVSATLNDESPTLYVRVGDIPLWLGILIAMGDALHRSRRRSRASAITEPGL
jgi:apolipoprotein N-acyltransferase